MKHFAIFLCMVIGYACVDSQRVEIGEDDSKADRDARKAASLDTHETITEDETIRSKDDLASVQSSETKASQKLSAAAKLMNVSSEVKKSGPTAQLGEPANDLWSILNHSHRNISANQHSIGDNRSLPRTSAPTRDTSLTSQMMFGLSYRTKSRGALAHRHATNCSSIEGLEELDTHGVISLMVKGYVEVPVSVETRLIRSYQEQYCRNVESFLGDVAPGYWNEVVMLRNRHTSPVETSAALNKYLDMRMRELEAYSRTVDESTRELYELIHSIQNGYEEGETVERVRTAFECPKKEIETVFQTMEDKWDSRSSWIMRIFVDIFLCVVFLNFIRFLCTCRNLNDRNGNENARLNMAHRPRVIWF